jgi:thioester reductase-like protein
VKTTTLQIGITYANVFKYQTPQKITEFLSNKRAETLSADISAYDYNVFDQLLAKNTLGAITQTPLGDILLTGATEFLGIHVLRELLENFPGKVYCLVRPIDGGSAEARLKTRLVYYFDNDYHEFFGKRLFTVAGDVNELKSLQAPVATVINCEVNLTHFSTGNEQEQVNVEGVRNLIAYCLKHKAMLIQYSTVCVAGVGNAALKDMKLKETQLYLGQTFESEYMLGRFLAEKLILEAIGKGLKAKIMRTGNPWSRNTDGEYQINFKSNSFMNRLKSFKLLGKIPVTFMGSAVDISPIDSTAKAILKLAETNSEYTVFHPCNNHVIYMSDIIYGMKEYGFAIDIVSEREFAECLREKMRDEESLPALTGILAYRNNSEKPVYSLGWTNDFTTEVLYRLNFKWPLPSEDYLKKAIAALDGLGFFEV